MNKTTLPQRSLFPTSCFAVPVPTPYFGHTPEEWSLWTNSVHYSRIKRCRWNRIRAAIFPFPAIFYICLQVKLEKKKGGRHSSRSLLWSQNMMWRTDAGTCRYLFNFHKKKMQPLFVELEFYSIRRACDCRFFMAPFECFWCVLLRNVIPLLCGRATEAPMCQSVYSYCLLFGSQLCV